MTKHHAEKLKKYQTDLDSIKRDPSGYINCYFDSIENKLKIFIDKATHHFDSIQSEVQRSKQECIASIRKCLDDFENVNVEKSDKIERIISTLQYQLECLQGNLLLNKDYILDLNENFAWSSICSFKGCQIGIYTDVSTDCIVPNALIEGMLLLFLYFSIFVLWFYF